MAALLADRMSFGRVFLAGDCAHITPPVGGLGGQTAIQDAADLAWKLALVVKGHAAPTLLDTYQIERRPVARIAIARAIANYVERLLPDRQELRIREDEYGLLETAMGYRYRSDAIIADEADDGAAVEDPLRPSGAPGTRLPHVWLRRGEETISSHDLIGRDFMLFAGPEGGDWIEAARNIRACAQSRRLASAASASTSTIPKGCFCRACAFRPKACFLCVPTATSPGVREAEAPTLSRRSRRVLRAPEEKSAPSSARRVTRRFSLEHPNDVANIVPAQLQPRVDRHNLRLLTKRSGACGTRLPWTMRF